MKYSNSILDALERINVKLGGRKDDAGTIVESLDQIADNIESGGGASIVIDPTLTHENQAAEAKAAGDRLTDIRAAVGSPLKASTASAMTDTDKIYVYTGSETGYTAGDWYYYDSTNETWTDGGIYNSIAVETDTTLSVSGGVADAKSTGDALATTLQKFKYVVNDAWLTANNITDVKQLTKNRIYLLNGVTKTNLTSMPTTSAASYYGALVLFDQVSPGLSPLLFFDNIGRLYSGMNIESAIRWIENATSTNIASLITAIQSLERKTFCTFGSMITDSWLSANNVNDVRQLTYNYCYIISGVTKSNLTNMPDVSANAYNGALLYFKQQVSAFQPLFFVDNLGNCWSGIDTGTTIRWRSLAQTYETINDALCRFYNKKVLILGDSIVYGNHMTDYQEGSRTVVTLEDDTVYKNNLSTTIWSYKFAQYITTNYGMTVVNNAFPGARYQDIVTYYDQLVTDTYDYVIICMGVNNWNNGGQVIPSLTALKSSFDAMGAKMIVMTPLGSTTYELYVGMIRGFIKEWGRDVKKEVGDLYSSFNEVNYLKGHTLSDVLIDGVHYNDASQNDIFEAVKKTLNL